VLFNSNEFLFGFLPASLIAFHVLRRMGWHPLSLVVLFCFSLYFYAASSPEYTLLFVGAICVNYVVGNRLAVRPSFALAAAAVAANLAAIAYFKYSAFGVTQANLLLGTDFGIPSVVLPVGISFYTFQNITFIVDAYKGKVKERNFVRYGVFVSFFPHLIAGPIVHHADIMPQFDRLERNSKLDDFAAGVCLFVIGLAKKTMIADPLGALASPMFDAAAAGTAPNLISAWVGELAYTFQIYFDFSAYSDMAYGLAMMFGIRLPANFFSPYKSRSIVEFWRRWHMTLSRLLRDYVYIPLGGNRRGPILRHVNLFATMLIGGLWHGAGWTFVLWGGLHGLYLIVNHAWNSLFRSSVRLGALAPLLTFLAVVVAWVPFRAADLDTTMSVYSAMFGFGTIALPLEVADLVRQLGIDPSVLGIGVYAENYRGDYYFGVAVLVTAALLAFVAPNSIEIMAPSRPVLYADRLLAEAEANSKRSAWRRVRFRPTLLAGGLTGAALMVELMIIDSAARSEFLYFQF
jgi:alginate O-acetyltransferase complex protein AlgI